MPSYLRYLVTGGLLVLITGLLLTSPAGFPPVAAGPAAAPRLVPTLSPTAPACGAAWQIVPSANQGSNDNYLESMATVAADDVWAVGDYNSVPTQRTLTEHWNGSSWTVVPSPNQGTADNHLYGVTAVAANDVWAVGTYMTTNPDFVTLIEHWNGSSWSIVPSPNQGTGRNVLIRVAAVGPNEVWAVGYWRDATNRDHTLTEHWNGSSWSIVPSPDGGTSGNYLESVAGVAANDVWAVGLSTQDQTVWLTLTEHWNGTSWSLVASPNPGTSGNFFIGLAVVAANDAWAVGNYHNYTSLHDTAAPATGRDPLPQVGAAPGVLGPDYTLTEHWDGSSWNMVSSPNQGSASYFRSVTAPAGNDVWAVNAYVNGSTDQTLIERWDGSGWSIVPSPNQGSSDNELRAVAALAPNEVWAVGYYSSGGVNHTLTEHYADTCPGTPSPTPSNTPTATGTPPTATSTPPPTFTPTATATPTCAPAWQIVSSPSIAPNENQLWDIGLLAPTDAWAVGHYVDPSLNRHTLTEHWDGSSWSIVPSPDLAGVRNRLVSLALVGPGDLWAGGTHDTAPNAPLLIEHWDGSAWTLVPGPSLGNTQSTILQAGAARAANDVWFAGSYQDGSSVVHALLIHWDGSAWTVVALPTLPGSGAGFQGLAVRAANDIWAVGWYSSSGANHTLTVHWNGTAWSVVPSPDGDSNSLLWRVGGAAANDVWAVGEGGGLGSVLIEHWNGTGWSLVANSITGNLYALTVRSAGDIWGLGGTTGFQRNIALHWDGTSWQPVPVPNPGDIDNNFRSAAQWPGGDVWAVGNFTLSGWNQTMVARLPACPGPSPTPTSTPPLPPPPTGTPPSTSTPTSTPVLTPTPTGTPLITPTRTRTATGTPTAAPSPTTTPGVPTATAGPSNTRAPSPTPAPTETPGGPGATPCALAFSDVHPPDYFYGPVLYLACHGVISGYADGTFRPYTTTTRSQMVKIIVLGFALPVTTPLGGAPTFTDVPPAQPFFAVIETAATAHIVSGYACGGPGEPCDDEQHPYFRPYASVTRGQLSKIAVLGAGWAVQSPPAGTFADVAPGSAFYPFVETATCHNIISGYACGGPGEPCDPQQRPYFRQQNDATRGQIAKIVYLAVSGSGGCAAGPAAQ